MQATKVIVIPERTSAKRPFIFLNALNMALCFFMLALLVAVCKASTQMKLDLFYVLMYSILGAGCILLAMLGIYGACKEKGWCLILFAVGMAAASQIMIVTTAMSYKPSYEGKVVNRELAFLSMMPLAKASNANRSMLYTVQQATDAGVILQSSSHVVACLPRLTQWKQRCDRLHEAPCSGVCALTLGQYQCCGLVDGYKDWGNSIPATCLCKDPERSCVKLQDKHTVGYPQKTIFVYQEPCLPIIMAKTKQAFTFGVCFRFGIALLWGVLLVISIKLKFQIKRKNEDISLLQSGIS